MSVPHLGEEEVEVRMVRLPGTLPLSPGRQAEGEGEGDRDTGSEEWLAYSGSGLPAVMGHSYLHFHPLYHTHFVLECWVPQRMAGSPPCPGGGSPPCQG